MLKTKLNIKTRFYKRVFLGKTLYEKAIVIWRYIFYWLFIPTIKRQRICAGRRRIEN
jgi:hypothetical protein